MAAKAAPKKNLSALKRARQAEKRNLRNRTERTRIRGVVKAVEAAVTENNKEAAITALRKAEKTISSATSKGILHKNNAARKISRLAKKTNALSKAGSA
ncbi:MAG: 30S ribosomal protein S20 [Nitrospirae bacterium]|nr:30S ribosomal protein S20 [Nitrospirota bacterium]